MKYGFKKDKTGFYLDRDDITVKIRIGKKGAFNVQAKTDYKILRTRYTGVKDKEKMMDDIVSLIKEKLNIDISSASSPPPSLTPSTGHEEEEGDIIMRNITFEQPEIIKMEAPPSDEEYEPLLVAKEEIDYKPISIDEEQNYNSADVEAELIAKSQEREFQPLNAQPNFPFGDKNIKIENNTEAVDVSLLDEVREKEGKFIVEKSQEQLYQTPMWNLTKISPFVLIVGATLIAYFIFFRKRIP